jgi:hypothetical protein
MLSNGIHIGRRGGVRLTGGGGETPWWLAGGISAGDVVAAYQAKGAASLAASYVNLANPGTYDAAPGVAPTWATGTGWTFNGTTQWLATGITPTNDRTWTMVVRFSGVVDSNNRIMMGLGRPDGASRWFALQATTGSRRFFSGGTLNIGSGLTTGVIGFAGTTGYTDGVAEIGTIPASAGTFYDTSMARDLAIAFGTQDDGHVNGPVGFFLGSIQAAFVASATLTAGQMAALSAAMAAL